MHSSTKSTRRTVLVLAAITLVGALLVYAAGEDELASAKTQYDRHNYRQAVQLLDAILATKPEGQLLTDAQRLRILALCKWNRPQDNLYGWQYGQQVMKENEALQKDAELWLVMGRNASGRRANQPAYEFLTKAADLYLADKKHDDYAAATMKQAEVLMRRNDILPQQKAVDDWQKKREIAVAEALKILLAVADNDGVSDDLRAKALLQAARAQTQTDGWEGAQKAIDLLTRAVKDFPKAEVAPDCQLMIGSHYQQYSRFVEAVQAYQAVIDGWRGSQQAQQAAERIKEIRAPIINLGDIQPHTPGAKAELYWQIRNVKTLSLAAYRVDLAKAVAAQPDDKGLINTLRRQRGENVANWTFETPDEGKHQYHEHHPTRPGDEQPKQTTTTIGVPFSEAGAYLIIASGKNAFGQSTDEACVVIFSAISAVVKTDGDNALVFVADAETGNPVEAADVTYLRQWGSRNRREYDSATGKTDDAGLAWLSDRRQDRFSWYVAVGKGADQALCGSGNFNWWWWGYQQAVKVYGFTDRPVYRPGDVARFKQIVRSHTEGKYANLPDTKVTVEIRNPKNEVIYNRELVTDAYGAAEGDLRIAADAPLGMYSIQVSARGSQIRNWATPGNAFRVEEYRKPEFEVKAVPAKGSYRVGDEVTININARYYFGQPVADAKVVYRIRKQNWSPRFAWPRPYPWLYDEMVGGGGYGRGGYGMRWWRPQYDELVVQGEGVTDAEGNLPVKVTAEAIAGHEDWDLKFLVHAEVTDTARRTVEADSEVKVTHAPFFIYPQPAQNVYQPGDSVEINVRTEDPNSNGVGGEFSAQAWRVEETREVVKDEETGKETVKITEELAQKLWEGKVAVGPEGRGNFRFTPDITAKVKVLVFTEDPELTGKGDKVEGSCVLYLAKQSGPLAHYAYNELQIIPSRDQYEIGQTLKVLVNTKFADATVLLTGEGDGIHFRRLVHVAENSQVVEIDIDEELSPNFTLSAVTMRNNLIYSDSKQIVVPPTNKFLKVVAELQKGDMGGGEGEDVNTFQPRETTTVKLTVTDVRTGKPVQGQITLMMVDSSVYYIQPELREAIEKAFYGTARRNMVGSADSYNNQFLQFGVYGYPQSWLFGSNARGGFMTGVEADFSVQPQALAAPMMSKSAGAEAPPAPPLAETFVRERFADTALWVGSVITDADGVATTKVTMPDQLTKFALHAIAHDKQTRVGQTEVDVVTAKKIIVRVQAPRFFTEGDNGWVTLIAHNYYDTEQALKLGLLAADDPAPTGGRKIWPALNIRRVMLDGEWRDYTPGERLDVTVKPGGEVRVDFLTSAERAGEVTITGAALGAKQSDRTLVRLPILTWGAAKLAAGGGILRGKDERLSGTATLTLPEAIKASSQSMTITLSPSIAAYAAESLPYLAAYPYGCVEQTLSRFVPSVLVRKTLGDAGVDLGEIKKLLDGADPKRRAYYEMLRRKYNRNPVFNADELDKMTAAGLKRLADFQKSDGGWGWWKSEPSNPYITAYATWALSLARDAGMKLPDGMLDRAVGFLVARASSKENINDRWRWATDNRNVRAFMLYAISVADAKKLDNAALLDWMGKLYDGRDDLTDYGRAYLALALHAAGQKDKAGIVVENFDNSAIINAKTNSVHWGRDGGWWYWYDGDIETTSTILMTMLKIAPDNKYIPMAAQYLVENRRDGYWSNTKSTAIAVYALMDYAKATGELDADQTVTVKLDDREVRTVRITRANLFSFDDRVEIPAADLAPGEHKVTVTRDGKGSLYWGAYLGWFDTAERITAGGNKIAVERTYTKLTPVEFTNERTVWRDGKRVKEPFKDLKWERGELAFGAEIASGEQIEVKLKVTCDNNSEYLVFEDPKPAGCEPVELRSGYSWGNFASNMELRDTKVVFFATYLGEGEHELTYRLRCEQPGTFRILPSSAEGMYTPFLQAISDSGKMTIVAESEKP